MIGGASLNADPQSRPWRDEIASAKAALPASRQNCARVADANCGATSGNCSGRVDQMPHDASHHS